MPKGKKAVDYAEIISLLNQSQKSTENLKAVAKQVGILEKAVAELNKLLSVDDANESEEAPAKEKKQYTGKPRGRRPKAESV